MKQAFLDTDHKPAGAVFSEDRKYRYLLWREWDSSKPTCTFVLLNPSTADEFVLDNTLKRCLAFAKQWGYGRMDILNLFALRSTDPTALYSSDDPVGPDNNEHLMKLEEGDMIVSGWGNHGVYKDRAAEVMRFLPSSMCLGINQNGTPKHPLYAASNTQLTQYLFKHGGPDGQ